MPIVIVTSGFFTRVDSPLGKQLRSTAEQIGGQFFKWIQLFEEKGVDRVKIAGKNWDNLPEQIAALGEKLHAEAGGKRTLVMIDELSGYDAPEDEEKTTLNWTALERIPKQVFLVLLFNPGFYDGKHLRLPSSCLSLHLPTTYRSTKGIINLHSCIATALERNAPSGNPGTEVEGELPKLVVLGDLGEVEEEEAAARIRFGFNMVQSFMAGSQKNEVTVIDDSYGLSSLLAEQAKEYNWTMKDVYDMYGGEADRVVVVGRGHLEAVSRARLCLSILLCCNDEESRDRYNFNASGYRAAIEQGLVEVAAPPWHPQVTKFFVREI